MKHATIMKPATPNGNRYFVEFVERNAKGERLVIEYFKQEFDNLSKHSLARIWKKNGFTDELLKTAWVIHDYTYDDAGSCWGNRYNPQIKLHESGGRYVIDFDWKKEATDEELNRLFDEIERRFYTE